MYVRACEEKDIQAIIGMVQIEMTIQNDEIASKIRNGKTALVYDDGAVKGCAIIATPQQVAGQRKVHLWLYTAPTYRGQGIGAKLWSDLQKHLQDLQADMVVTNFRPDIGSSVDFFGKRGFIKWFSTSLMEYSGGKFPEPEITYTNYANKYFHTYIDLENEAFYSLRKENDIEPYNCFPKSSYQDAELKKQMLQKRGRVFLFLDDDEVIGYAVIEKHFIDLVVVAPKHQGQGYGRLITKFATNRIIEKGHDKVLLGVVDTNLGARKLYDSLGFKLKETHVYARITK